MTRETGESRKNRKFTSKETRKKTKKPTINKKKKRQDVPRKPKKSLNQVRYYKVCRSQRKLNREKYAKLSIRDLKQQTVEHLCGLQSLKERVGFQEKLHNVKSNQDLGTILQKLRKDERMLKKKLSGARKNSQMERQKNKRKSNVLLEKLNELKSQLNRSQRRDERISLLSKDLKVKSKLLKIRQQAENAKKNVNSLNAKEAYEQALEKLESTRKQTEAARTFLDDEKLLNEKLQFELGNLRSNYYRRTNDDNYQRPIAEYYHHERSYKRFDPVPNPEKNRPNETGSRPANMNDYNDQNVFYFNPLEINGETNIGYNDVNKRYEESNFPYAPNDFSRTEGVYKEDNYRSSGFPDVPRTRDFYQGAPYDTPIDTTRVTSRSPSLSGDSGAKSISTSLVQCSVQYFLNMQKQQKSLEHSSVSDELVLQKENTFTTYSVDSDDRSRDPSDSNDGHSGGLFDSRNDGCPIPCEEPTNLSRTASDENSDERNGPTVDSVSSDDGNALADDDSVPDTHVHSINSHDFPQKMKDPRLFHFFDDQPGEVKEQLRSGNMGNNGFNPQIKCNISEISRIVSTNQELSIEINRSPMAGSVSGGADSIPSHDGDEASVECSRSDSLNRILRCGGNDIILSPYVTESYFKYVDGTCESPTWDFACEATSPFCNDNHFFNDIDQNHLLPSDMFN